MAFDKEMFEAMASTDEGKAFIEQQKHNLVYEIRNKINNKFYIGVHKTNNVNDDYMGSGTNIRRAIKKYGLDNFTKTIIEDAPTYEQALELEELIVDEEFLSRKDTYNLKTGGMQGLASNETKERMSISKKADKNPMYKIGSDHPMFGKSHSDETKQKMRESIKGKGMTGKNQSKEAKELLSQYQKNKPVVECPHCNKTGKELVMKRWHFNNCKTLLVGE